MFTRRLPVVAFSLTLALGLMPVDVVTAAKDEKRIQQKGSRGNYGQDEGKEEVELVSVCLNVCDFIIVVHRIVKLSKVTFPEVHFVVHRKAANTSLHQDECQEKVHSESWGFAGAGIVAANEGVKEKEDEQGCHCNDNGSHAGVNEILQ